MSQSYKIIKAIHKSTQTFKVSWNNIFKSWWTFFICTTLRLYSSMIWRLSLFVVFNVVRCFCIVLIILLSTNLGHSFTIFFFTRIFWRLGISCSWAGNPWPICKKICIIKNTFVTDCEKFTYLAFSRYRYFWNYYNSSIPLIVFQRNQVCMYHTEKWIKIGDWTHYSHTFLKEPIIFY